MNKSKGGRPPIEDGNVLHPASFNLTPSQTLWIKKKANLSGKSQSAFMRELVKKEMENDEELTQTG